MRSISHGLLVTGIAVLLVLSSPIRRTQATTGVLDDSFGSGGKVVTRVFYDSKLSAVAIQADDKIVATGFNRQTNGGATDLAVLRYNSDGQLDASFGNGGLVLAGRKGYSASDVVVQPDGKIVAGGTGDSDFALVRYNSDGSLDQSFGAGGFVTTDFFDGENGVVALVVQPDGKIIAGGYTYPKRNGSPPFGFALARYNSDGSLDGSFGEQGLLSSASALKSELLADIALQPDGKILVLGTAYSGGTDYDWVLARYNTDGSADRGFGVDGRTRTDFGGYDRARSLSIDSKGKVVAYGNTGDDVFYFKFSDLALARYEADGSLDSQFGSGGKVKIDFGKFEEAGAILHQPDGKLVVAGFSNDMPSWAGTFSDFLLSRFNVNGTLDSSFGPGGRMTTDFGRTDRARALALQSDGKLVAVGYSGEPTYDGFDQSDFALARYTGFILPDFTLDSPSKTISASRGDKINLTIDVNRLGDFGGNVTITGPDLGNLKMKLTPDTATTSSGSVDFKLKVKKAPRGEHQLLFTGRDETGRERTLTIIVVIR